MDANPMPLDEAVKHLQQMLRDKNQYIYDITGIDEGDFIALGVALAALSQPQAVPSWRPIAEAPTDETTIERWHRVWNCPVAVQRNNGRIPSHPEWITATKDQTWPEEAFTPHFRALSAPPQGAEKARRDAAQEGGL